MDSETKFYVVLGLIIFVAIVIGWMAINNYQQSGGPVFWPFR